MTPGGSTSLHRKGRKGEARGGRSARCLSAAACIAVVLGAALSLVGCGPKPEDTSPVGVTRRLVAAATLRDRDAAFELLGPETRKRLEVEARRANALGGGKPRLAAKDMLSLAWRAEAEPDWKPKGYTLLGVEGDGARVEVRGGSKKQRQVVRLVRVKGLWRVELDLPPDVGAGP